MSEDKPALLEELKPGVRVKCIFCGTPRYNETATIVSVDTYNIITVKWDDGKDILSEWRYASSFSIIDSPEVTPQSKTISSSNTAATDPEEDRLWKMMRPHIPLGECICGGPKNLCPYHKDQP